MKVEGHDVRDLNANSLRAATALVSQDTALFDDTVASNIALGRLGADAADIETAAKSSQCA